MAENEMGMVERVARAIQAFDGHAAAGGAEPGYEAIARAAIAAMREPTDEMMSVTEWWGDLTGRPEHVDVWRAMIDAALTE